MERSFTVYNIYMYTDKMIIDVHHIEIAIFKLEMLNTKSIQIYFSK